MKETDFLAKNCRSAKKISQLRQVLKNNGSATFVVEMYIYCTKKYFVKLYKRHCMFNLLLMHFFHFFLSSLVSSSSDLKFAIIKSYYFISPDIMSRPFMPLVDFKMNVIKWKLHFVSCNFSLKSNL